MELSPEEKERIYKQEDARLEAQEKAKKELRIKKLKQDGCSVAGLYLVVIILTMGLFGCSYDSGNKSPSEKSIKSDLEYGLRNYKQVSIRGVSLVGRKLIVSVSIDRTSPQAFFAAIGGIHGGIAVIKPDIDTVVIEDIIGQRITVGMSKLLACYNKQISFREFRDTWDIVNP
ncbi:MAG: WVD2 family protein [Deltaproteobacteria bacterium]|nr:WVD2 family protein [Deltaproteobacteria bacterium]